MDFEGPALDMFLPVMESATVLAAHYAKACGRDIVLAEDMKYGLMYSARHVAGKQIGSLFPEIYEDESVDSSGDEDEESSDSEESDSLEPDWVRYAGQEDDMALKMNECYDTWSSWEPQSPAECALKAAVDKMGV
jgi:hypothetical protein